MKIKIKSKYLIFPVNTKFPNKQVEFFIGDKSVHKLNIRLDNVDPDFEAYINVSRFMGETVEIKVDPQMEFTYKEADEMVFADQYKETYRPQVHFTTKNGWLNDPNGLIYLDGVYHMFYQHNHASNNWDNMQWGHAVSTDMIHWQEQDIAIFMDDERMIYSGSGIFDKDNVSGLGTKENPPALLFYTLTKPYVQCIAYSCDNFKTVKKFENNPVIENVDDRNRDPKVVYCEEIGAFVIALYLMEDVYIIFSSENLIEWKEIQRISLPGDRECPDIFPIKNHKGEKRWILMGANDKYYVGEWKNGQFTPVQPIQTLHYGDSGYAGQTFSGLPDGRVVRMVWDRWNISTPRINGQMGVPMDFTITYDNSVEYLTANPIAEFESLYADTQKFNDITIAPQKDFNLDVKDTAYLIKIKGEYPESGEMKFEIFGRSFFVNFDKNHIKLGEKTAPISVNKTFELTIIVDRCSYEVFSDKGRSYISAINNSTVMDRNLKNLKISADEGINIKEIEVNSLNSIWE